LGECVYQSNQGMFFSVHFIILSSIYWIPHLKNEIPIVYALLEVIISVFL